VTGTSRPGDDAAPAAGRYPLELPITFEGGAGLTRLLGREEVRFATDAALAGGQRLAGLVRLPAEGAAAGLVLRYVARVAGVRPPAGPEGVFEVSARFERLDLAAEGTA
jgi:hypothetical protein